MKPMQTWIRVTMPDKTEWEVPLQTIYDGIVDLYVHLGKKYDEACNIADEHVQADEDIIDFAQNNMDWKDVERQAVCVKCVPSVDYQDGWVNGKMEVVEHR